MKQARHSKTLWLNWVVLLLAAAVELSPQLQAVLPRHAALATLAVAAANIALRHLTTQPLAPPRPRQRPPPTIT